MNKQQILKEIRECEDRLNDLKELAKNMKDDLDKLSYKDLMKVFFENEQFYNVQTREQRELQEEWKSAYDKFRKLRDKRDELVKEKIQNSIVYLTKRNPNPEMYALKLDTVVDYVFSDILSLYEDITPFDCEDKKYLDKRCRNQNYWSSLTNWGNRVNLLVHKYGSGMINGNTYRIPKENIVVLCK